MMKTSLGMLSAMAAVAFTLTSCVGARTEIDPDRHPDAAKRQEMRHFYDKQHKRLIRNHA